MPINTKNINDGNRIWDKKIMDQVIKKKFLSSYSTYTDFQQHAKKPEVDDLKARCETGPTHKEIKDAWDSAEALLKGPRNDHGPLALDWAAITTAMSRGFDSVVCLGLGSFATSPNLKLTMARHFFALSMCGMLSKYLYVNLDHFIGHAGEPQAKSHRHKNSEEILQARFYDPNYKDVDREFLNGQSTVAGNISTFCTPDIWKYTRSERTVVIIIKPDQPYRQILADDVASHASEQQLGGIICAPAWDNCSERDPLTDYVADWLNGMWVDNLIWDNRDVPGQLALGALNFYYKKEFSRHF